MKINLLIFSFIICICLSVTTVAQSFSIYVAPGFMKYQGDLNVSTSPFVNANFCVATGINYKTGHFVFRSDFLQGSVSGVDSKGNAQTIRNLNFTSTITEYSLGLEYDLFDIDGDKKMTPYIFGTVGFFHFNPFTYDTTGNKTYLQPLGTEGQGLIQYPDRKFYKLTQINNSFGGGIKYKINNNFTIGFELIARKLYTDYLDDVSTTYPMQQALLNARGLLAVKLSFRADEINPKAVYIDDKRRGNPDSNDSYYNFLFKVGYTFSRNNSLGYSRTKRDKSTRCPVHVY